MISVTVKNGSVVLALSERLQRFGPQVFAEIGTALLGRINKGFEDETEPEGSAWAQLKRATVRQRGGDAHPILRRSGDLKRSITYRVEPDGVFVGTNRVYAAIHQFGGEIKRESGAVKLHFRRVTRGKMRGRTLFAKADDKRASFGIAAAAHSIRIPARPYLFGRDGGIPEDWQTAILVIVKRHLEAGHA